MYDFFYSVVNSFGTFLLKFSTDLSQSYSYLVWNFTRITVKLFSGVCDSSFFSYAQKILFLAQVGDYKELLYIDTDSFILQLHTPPHRFF